MTDTSDQTVLSLHRAFYWGIVVIGDSRSTTVPSLGADGAIAQNATCIVVPVRHAQDFDSEVEEGPACVSVDCRLANSPGSLTFRSIIEVPSGILTVGDAEHEDKVAIEAGRWIVAIDRSPTPNPEQIQIWLSPTET